ncbi:DNA-binding protein [Ectothiorhodospiraceae bacterium BW-2]|nr:DNA-binding protein [Ectothiorhodospiraceae bacterium BW-2]
MTKIESHDETRSLYWWERQQQHFEIYISEAVIAEAARGDPQAAEKRLTAIQGLTELSVTPESKQLATAFIDAGSLPVKAELDALPIANAIMRPKIERVCLHHGYQPPIICTPSELFEE